MKRPAVLLSVLILVACGDGATAVDRGSADAVADRFVDLYVLEIDQQRALELTTGNARRRIEEEIEQVAGIRGQGYSAAAAKPRVFYERTRLDVDDGAGTARAVYEVRMEAAGVETRRQLLVSLSKREGPWQISSFALRDLGPADE